MPSIRKLKNKILTLPISRRNALHPFEFGRVASQDRAMAESRIQMSGQGKLLNQSTKVKQFLRIKGGVSPGIGTAKSSFRSIQCYFESAKVESMLMPWAVFGFMSDSFIPNGLAARLHSENDNKHFINVTFGAFLHPLLAAYHVTADSDFEPDLPSRAGRMSVNAQDFFNCELEISLDAERRSRAVQFAGMALQATFFHELAHILRGHTSYVAEKKPFGAIAEMKSGSSPHDSVDLLGRAMETDADDFSGRFLAKSYFKEKEIGELKWSNPLVRARAYNVLVGVTLMYSWFAKSEGYHSGTLRAYVVTGSMLCELELATKETASWMHEKINTLQAALVQRNILPCSATDLSLDEAKDLLNHTMDLRENSMRDWLRLRPWGFEDDGK